MLEIFRDEKGNIIGCCEWWVVNEMAKFDTKGEFVWVEELEISKDYRNNGVLKKFIKTITEKAPQTKYGYFYRQRKYPNRPPHTYSRQRWLRRLNKE